MCLCWNPDGSMCVDPAEIRRRIDLHMKGLYKPELKRLREEHIRKRRAQMLTKKGMTTEEQYQEYLSHTYDNYNWPWKRGI